MDVRCERCSTEYEFDDALVSGRGTTVKCTNCGHKFRIRRRDGDFSEDFWNVQTRDGRTLVFTSLRELQRAIQTQLVDRADMLSRGGLPPKAIGQIPELAPFFETKEPRTSLPPAPPPFRESLPDAPPRRSSRPPPPPGATAPALAPPRARMSTRPDFPPEAYAERPATVPIERPALPAPAPAEMRKTLLGTGAFADAALATQMAERQAPPVLDVEPSLPPPMIAPAPPRMATDPPPTDREEEPRHAMASEPPVVDPPAEVLEPTEPLAPRVRSEPPFAEPTPLRSFEGSSPLPAPLAAVSPAARAYDDDLDGRRSRGSFPDAPTSIGRRRPVGGFVVAFLVLAGAAVLGVVYARDHGLLAPKPATVAARDPRTTAFLDTGEKALADGNLELAKESFDKASALAEKDPRVLLDVARLASNRADVPWLRGRLVPEAAADEQRLARETLAELSAAARKASDDALAVAPDDPAALRAKIDALRIAGDRDGARGLVARVAASGSQPETAYVLAALDLAEKEPLWSTVIERLRAAASAESGPGRARAALVYALARAGDGAGAKAEVERLASMARPHPLLPLLRAFAERAASSKPDGGAPDASAIAALDPKRPPDGKDGKLDKPDKPEKTDRKGKPLASDPRVLVAQGEAARAKGQYDRAQELYSAALEKNPSDTEALSGLAAISYARRDLNNARSSYKRVLSINPSYVPALVGLGDVEWDSGDRASAMKTYKEIVDRFPEGTYPSRVKQRIDGGGSPAPAPADPGGGG